MSMFQWNVKQEKELCRLVADGKTYQEIADHFGNGVTRNAIIGKANRLGIKKPKDDRGRHLRGQKHDPEAAHKGAENAMRESKRLKELRKEDPHKDDKSKLKKLSALKRIDCRFPYGDPKDPDFGFCGLPIGDSASYCPYHAKVALLPQTKKQKGEKE